VTKSASASSGTTDTALSGHDNKTFLNGKAYISFQSQVWFLQMIFPVWSNRTQPVKVSHFLNPSTAFQKFEITYWASQWRSQQLSEQFNSG